MFTPLLKHIERYQFTHQQTAVSSRSEFDAQQTLNASRSSSSCSSMHARQRRNHCTRLFLTRTHTFYRFHATAVSLTVRHSPQRAEARAKTIDFQFSVLSSVAARSNATYSPILRRGCCFRRSTQSTGVSQCRRALLSGICIWGENIIPT